MKSVLDVIVTLVMKLDTYTLILVPRLVTFVSAVSITPRLTRRTRPPVRPISICLGRNPRPNAPASSISSSPMIGSIWMRNVLAFTYLASRAPNLSRDPRGTLTRLTETSNARRYGSTQVCGAMLSVQTEGTPSTCTSRNPKFAVPARNELDEVWYSATSTAEHGCQCPSYLHGFRLSPRLCFLTFLEKKKSYEKIHT
ncbi:hypothetical protein M404DRAFT_429432 [Pisolithus tinctorius Marx 270]|uniref:Uncharacterized protein n=1 Tax=Pisolithus tinctorius Marx 270 TaxID=870435 RepID=A0A0C3PGP8_PISTI|nr:hypothetical protein M404DRAFT_429432 [Pisolithus tinctorius Marx 270]